MRNVARFTRTVRHLKPSQVAWRAYYMALRRLEGRGFRLTLPASGAGRAQLSGQPLPESLRDSPGSASAASILSDLREGHLTQLNERRPFRGGEDWRMLGGRGEARLWTYHLHYHEWIFDLGSEFAKTGDRALAAEARRWLRDWIEVCRVGAPGFAHYPWNSFATATRIGWWSRLWHVVPDAFWDGDTALREQFVASLWEQAEYLSSHIEWDLRGNHLLRDAAGLAAAAQLFRGADANRWRTQARLLLAGQVDEQVLPDGAHFERSPVYHLQVMEDVARTALLLGDAESARVLDAVWERMTEFATWLRHPDGSAPLLNDASGDGAGAFPRVATLSASAGRPVNSAMPRGARHFEHAGIAVLHTPAWSVFFDVGVVGPDYQPGHAHADTLTVEASAASHRLLLDPGIFAYDRDERRDYSRSTAAHNTVCVDETNSTEVWDIFRVGRRAVPRDVRITTHPGQLRASASHDGYDGLPGAPAHERTVIADNATLLVEDRISGEGEHRASGGWLVHPAWSIEISARGWQLRHESGARVSLALVATPAVATAVRPVEYFPLLGRAEPAQRIEWTYDGTLPLSVRSTFSIEMGDG